MTIKTNKFSRHACNNAAVGTGLAAKLAATTALFFAVVVSPVRAQGIPVVDATAISNQLVAISHAVSQVTPLNNQLTNMQQQLKSITGSRGMGLLATAVDRNYLGGTLGNIAQSSQQMAANIQSIMGNNAFLTNDQLNKLSSEERDRILNYRRQVATQKAAADMAYSNASSNIARIQQLMNTIDSASDAKAIADLQARIQAEQVMLQNDAIKMHQLQQGMEADRRALELQREEVRKKLLGSSTSRFPDIKVQ